MKLLEKILVPVDFTRKTDTLVESIIQLAKNYDSLVILMTVLPEDAKKKSIEAVVKEHIAAKLNEIKGKLVSEGIHVNEPLAFYGNSYDNITHIARTENVNVLLMASDHFDEDEKTILSSIVERLVRKSEKPVWVAKQGNKMKMDKILCPVDFSSAAERALKNAIQFARKNKAELTILTVFEPLKGNTIFAEIDEAEENRKKEEQAEKSMQGFLQKFNLADVNYKSVVLAGKPAEMILQYIKSEQTDLLVMGTTGRSALGTLLIGSVTEKVIRHIPCSFVTTKSEDIIHLKLENEIKDIEEHTNIAKKLEENGFLKEAIGQYEICLRINDMHIPSHYSIAKLYKKMGQEQMAQKYENLASHLLGKLWDRHIEREIRKHYSV